LPQYIERSPKLKDAEQKIENEIRRFERKLQKIISSEDYAELKKYRVINNLISVKELKDPTALFKSSEQIRDLANGESKEAAPKVPTAILTYNKDDKEVIASSEIESAFTVFLSSLHASGSIESVFNGTGPASNISNASDPQWCGTMCPDNTCKCQFPYSRWC